MKQPSVYSLEQIIAAAFAIIRQDGREKVTARAIAKELGSSTMPIYTRVKSMDDLDLDLKKKTRKLLVEYQKRGYTQDPLLNMAIGYIVFARDEKNAFRYLFLEKTEALQEDRMGSNMREAFAEDFGKEAEQTGTLSDMTPEQQEFLMKHTWIFTHGLAMLAYGGNLEQKKDDEIIGYLQNAGGAFYMWVTMGPFSLEKAPND
jgi:AcrR family transcriptional regulator